MAIQSSFLSLRYMVSYTPSPTSGSHPHLPVLRRPAHAGHGSLSLQSRSMRTTRPHRLRRLINAIEEEKQETVTASETESSSSNSSVGSGYAKPRSGKGVEIETTEVVASSEIKEAIKEKRRREREGDDLWSGVAEEIREIEWPAFGKVVGTTGVVLGVIAGSSVVLLTVNAVLAELSDRVFAGRGVQDFFS